MGLAPILVVDDESDMRTALSHALSRGGFSVESVASGTEALIKLKKDPFGMVITDLKMPEMSGMEVLGAVKKLSPQIPVIMITPMKDMMEKFVPVAARTATTPTNPKGTERIITSGSRKLRNWATITKYTNVIIGMFMNRFSGAM